MNRITILLSALCLALLCACQGNQQTEPAYLSIDAVALAHGDDDNWNHKEPGFFTYLIDAVYITYYVEGDTAWTTLGTFQLPCEVPVLREGKIDRMIIQPVVKQNGIAATRIPYPYYTDIELEDVTLTIGETTHLDTLRTSYKSSELVSVPWEEYFTPTTDMHLDSIVQRCTDLSIVRTGGGCGVVHVTEDMESASFWSTDTFAVLDPQKNIYLEMDYWTDFNFSVGFNNPTQAGTSNVIESAMVLYANQGWQKIYINLGKLWNQYNHYPYLRLYFTILNSEGRSGNLYLDNMKVVTI